MEEDKIGDEDLYHYERFMNSKIKHNKILIKWFIFVLSLLLIINLQWSVHVYKNTSEITHIIEMNIFLLLFY